MTSQEQKAQPAGRREWIGLAVLALPTFLVSIDVFVLLLALPRISADLGASATQQLWITDAYGFLLAGCMITMGTLGDRIGRRKLLMIGAAAFGAVSVLAAFSVSAEMLIVARALLGIAGATLMPSTLALISTMFPDPRQRGTAISIWMVCFMGGAAVGPVIGGLVLDALWWGAVFLLGVPAMAVLLAAGPLVLPEFRDTSRPVRLDLPSAALSLVAILLVVHGLKETAAHGWAPLPTSTLVAGIAVAVLFVRRQRRVPDPLLDLALFRDRTFSVALCTMLVGTLATGAMMLFITQHLQLVLGLSALVAALWMVPAMLASIAGSLASPALAARFRPAWVIGGGLLVCVAGLLALAATGEQLAPLVIGFSLITLGSGPLAALGTDLIIGAAPQAKAGSAASLSEVSGEFGYAMGIATIGSIGALVYSSRIPEGVPAQAAESLSGATGVAAGLPAEAGRVLLATARQAYIAGMHTAALVAAAALLVVAAATTALLRDVAPSVAKADDVP
ncbi:MFS transporter [Actinomycetes bacterium KLBMP 9759]